MKTTCGTRLLLSSLCILALSAYAGCDSARVSSTTMSHASQQSQKEQKSDSKLPGKLQMKTLTVDTPDGQVDFNVEVADTNDARTTGLMYREEMPMHDGMVFIFEEPQPLTFWMKNTLIPLDIIYIDRDWKILSIQKQARPCEADPCILYPSSGNAQYVLEINGGLSDKLGILQGSRAQLQ